MSTDREERTAWSFAGPIVLGLAIVVSVFVVARNERAAHHPGKTVLRFLHWQLEAGYRTAIDRAIQDYERLHPDVEIVQMAVSDIVYDQFLNTNLVSGIAPDIAEVGKGKFNSDEQYTARFFLPLDTYISEPNPYNKGTPLEGVSWKETFIDGMRGGYRFQLQDYNRIALGLSQRRYFYNKDLYRTIAGTDVPPKTFGQLMDVGKKTRAWAKAHQRQLVTVVNAENRFGPWSKENLTPFQVPFTSNLDDVVDTNLDGDTLGVETYASYLRGEWKINGPYLSGFHHLMKDMTSLYEPGYLGMDRQTAMFRFTNEQAMMFFTGSWDATSIVKQCEGRFEVGVIEFPIPGPGEPLSSEVRGPATEANSAGWSGWGVYKNSPHPEIAIDFLRFVTSQPENGPVMEIASWPPIVIGSPTSDRMKPFIANPVGYSSRLEIALADYGNPGAVYFNELAGYLQGEVTLDQFAAAYDAAVRDPENGGDYIWAQEYASYRQQTRTEERLLSIQSLRQMMDPSATDAAEKYRRSLIVQVRNNVGEEYRYRFEQLRHRPISRL